MQLAKRKFERSIDVAREKREKKVKTIGFLLSSNIESYQF